MPDELYGLQYWMHLPAEGVYFTHLIPIVQDWQKNNNILNNNNHKSLEQKLNIN